MSVRALLQNTINYSFGDEALLRTALTHASRSDNTTYERLEFLGDRVLGLVVAEILYAKFPKEAEGDLARRLASLVQGATLADIAREITLGQYIRLSASERESGGGENDHILADVMEAILGALYLDGGYAPCKKLIEALWGNRFERMTRPPQHPKTQLQEWAQGQSLPLPAYDLVRQTGPDHAPVFEIEVSVQGHTSAKAQGKSRQEAEKAAAKAFIKAQKL